MTKVTRAILVACAMAFFLTGIGLFRWRPNIDEPPNMAISVTTLALPTSLDAALSAEQILARNPFSSDRGPFRAGLHPALPVVEPRLVAVAQMADGMRATLMFGPDQFSAFEGDETPAGRILLIEGDTITLDGGRRLELFPSNDLSGLPPTMAPLAITSNLMPQVGGVASLVPDHLPPPPLNQGAPPGPPPIPGWPGGPQLAPDGPMGPLAIPGSLNWPSPAIEDSPS